MELLITILSNFLHIIRFVILCSYFVALEKKFSKYLKYIPIALMLIVTVFVWNNSNVIAQSLAYYVCLIGTVMCLYQMKWWKIPIMTIWVMSLLEMFTQMSNVIVESVYRMLSCNSTYEIMVLIEQLVALLITCCLCAVVYYKNRQGIKSLKLTTIIFFTIVCVADSMVLTFMANFVENVDTSQRVRFELVFLIIVIGILAQMALLIWNFTVRNNLLENETLLKKYLEVQQDHYEYLEKRELETKKFRHDLRNHMYVLQSLYDNQDAEEIQKYLKKMNQQIEQFGSRISVNYNIVDAILNKYASMAEDYGIDMQVSGKFPLNCEISAYDLCTILSNMLSNAIEAAEQCDKGWIRAEFAYDEQDIIMIVQNNYIGQVSYANGHIQTKKQDKHNHGIGLHNMIAAVEHNGGDFDIRTENQIFRIRVFLKYIQKNQEEV